MKNLLLIFSFAALLFAPKLNAQYSFYVSFVTSDCSPAVVNFINTSSSGDHFYWYFGDGNYLNDSYNATNNYLYAGTYTVYMDVFDASYNYLDTYTQEVTINGQLQYINKTASTICPNDPVQFYVYPDANSFDWSFSDGYNVTETNGFVQHSFTTPGWNYVSVSYFDNMCGSYYTVDDSVFVDPTNPWFNSYPGMGVSNTNACPGTPIFFDIYGGPYQSYDWDFGDGGSSFDPYTEYTYSLNGAYTVSATLMNGCGVDTTLFTNVVIDNTTPAPTVTINGPSEVCPGEEVYFTAYASEPLIYSWNFGDGSPIETSTDGYMYHVFPNTGTFIVQLTVENLCGNTSTTNYTVEGTNSAPLFNPYFDISPQVVCPGDEVNYWTPYYYSYFINFGDGSTTTSGYSHSFDIVGNYTVTAVLQNTCGMTDTLFQTVQVTNSAPIDPYSIYASVYPSEVCPGENMNFYANNGYSSYEWNFDDGYTANYHEANHPYSFAGNYDVSVTITNGCGNDTTVFLNAIVSDNLPVSDLDWGVFATAVCPGTEVYMSVENYANYDVVWNFGDGSTSTEEYTSHVYDNAGSYNISVTVTNGCGNDSTATQSLVVGNGLTPDLSQIDFEIQTPGCAGDNLYFAVIPAGLGLYEWEFGDGESGVSDDLIYVEGQPIVTTFHSYDDPGTYDVLFTFTNECGISVDSNFQVTIGGYGDLFEDMQISFWYDESDVQCEGQPVTFLSVGAGTYIWDFGDGSGNLVTYNSLSPVEHVYNNDGSYVVTVVGLDACGNSDEDSEILFVPNSDIHITTNTVQDADCGFNNGVAVASASGGTQPYEFSWTNGDQGIIADSLGSGIYTITVTDNNGCTAEALAAVSDDQGPVILLQSIVHNDCYGQDNGVIAVSIFGGAPPYEILWSNGETTEDIYNLESGPYEIYVTDANGCFAAQSFTVTSPIESVVSVLTQPASCGSNNGQAVANLSNAVTPLNFIWPNGSGSSNSTGGLASGVYDVMIIDGNTCLHEATFAVSEEFGPVIITDSIADPTCSGDLSAVYISTIGGAAPFTYEWSNGSTSEDLTGVLPGEYFVEIEGSNGCSSFKHFDVQMSPPAETDICIVTVDTNTNSNLIVWNPVNAADVVSYNIYKESSQSGLYFLVANQSADSISQYYDYPSNPAIKSWRYKVAAVDDCGNEAELSDPHKTIHLTSNLGVGGVVNLIWDHYNGFNYDTYYIWRYHPSTDWVKLDSVGSNNTSYTDLTPPSDSNLVYIIEILPPSICTASKAQDHNSSRSNKSSINMPDFGEPNSIEEKDQTFSIYPNPTTGLVQLLYSETIQEIRVYDLSGQLVFTSLNNDTFATVDLSMFADGIYTLELVTENGLVRNRVVKK